MSDFLDEREEFPRQQQPDTTPYMVRLVLATGIVSDQRKAEYVLLGMAIFLIACAFALPLLVGNSYTPTQTDLLRQMDAPGLSPGTTPQTTL